MKKTLRFVFLVSLISCLLFTTVLANGEPKIVESKSIDESLIFYVKGITSQINSASALIGTSQCDDVTVSYMNDGSFHMNTLFLIDNSISIPEASRESIKNIMIETVAGRSDHEKFAVALFSENVNVIQGLTEDYSTLKGTIEGIQYADQETYLTDVLYDLLSQDAFQEEDAYHFDRIVVFSDGVDNKSIGYTENELEEIVSEKKIPIYTVGSYNKKKSNQDQLKKMFAIARTSRGESFLLDELNDPLEVAESLKADRDMAQVIVKPDSTLLDGSKKTVSLTLDSLNLKENNVLMAQVAGTKTEEEETVESSEETTETQDTESTENKQPMPTPVDTSGKESGNMSILVLIIAGVVLLAGIIITVVALKKKKGSNKSQPVNSYNSNPYASGMRDGEKTAQLFDDGETVQLFGGGADDSDEKTLYLYNDAQTPTLVLTDLSDPSRQFKSPLRNKIVIGRKQEKSDICINYDKAVSSQHCEILLRNDRMYIRDLDSSNGTFVNGSRIYDETEIRSGDMLKLGRVELRVEMN